jgi:pyruvate dehydrogenase E1 component
MKFKEPNARVSHQLERLVPASERNVPIVTVSDGHSHTLAFLGGILGAKVISLGVDKFGQSGSRGELYKHYGISTANISLACNLALDH